MLQKVLIVDHSDLIHHMYRLMLHRYGCEFADATNGSEALEVLESDDKISMILLEINMPVMNGVQFLKKALALGISQRIPIIVISLEGKEDDAALALKLGARGYLRKPFQPGDLYSLIEKVMQTPPGGELAALPKAEGC